MNHSGHRTKPAPEPGNHLRCKRNFRHKNNRASSVIQSTAYCRHENFRFPASRHSVKQEPSAFPVQAGQYFFQCLLLSGRQRETRIFRLFKSVSGGTKHFLAFQSDHAVRGQLFQCFVRVLYKGGYFLHCMNVFVGKESQQSRPFGAAFFPFRR